jgi:hypothetical protein
MSASRDSAKGSGGAPDAPLPPGEDPCRRRILRPRPEKRARVCSNSAVTVYRVGPSIAPGDREDLADTLRQFHSSERIQSECTAVLENAQKYLTLGSLAAKGSHYTAAREIPARERIAFYSGFLERADACHARDHEMCLGEEVLGYELTIDGTPGRAPDDDARSGRLQILNHCCAPGNNCDCISEVCPVTFLPLFICVTNRVVAEGQELTFAYQKVQRHKGVPRIAACAFWQDADVLSARAIPRGMAVVRCNCHGGQCPNGWGRLERAPHPPPPPLPLRHSTFPPLPPPCPPLPTLPLPPPPPPLSPSIFPSPPASPPPPGAAHVPPDRLPPAG